MQYKDYGKLKTLLLVDDDTDDQELFKLALAELDHPVKCLTAGNGQEALDNLCTHAYRPDLIFLDLNMPLMNGIVFLKRIKDIDHLKNIPVIIYSTSDEPREISAARSMGAVDYITKPTRFDELCRLLKVVLAGDTSLH
ncbi:Response regulator receiver domain-containing protein [Chitinophaga eiseniae]|uniref:Response regulator receiver domain-containing protein n=1 Tax=Chitinophaga eiseniae TaxID=634771 RepID=A0A1T4TU99_9BACT|nr:response regulator [Chitinophaga eiseniae]SKA43769.1 Response regulator receiver domain-containing protein [Chitinophaga eiseniae]